MRIRGNLNQSLARLWSKLVLQCSVVPQNICFLDKDLATNVPNAMLLSAQSHSSLLFGNVVAFYDWHFNPLIYIIVESEQPSAGKLKKICRKLALNGNCSSMGVLKDNQLGWSLEDAVESFFSKDTRMRIQV